MHDMSQRVQPVLVNNLFLFNLKIRDSRILNAAYLYVKKKLLQLLIIISIEYSRLDMHFLRMYSRV